MNDDDRRDLIERVHQMQELEQHPGWPLLVDYVNARLAIEHRRLIEGNPASWEDYRQQVGFGRGIRYVLGATKELAAKLEREIVQEQEEVPA